MLPAPSHALRLVRHSVPAVKLGLRRVLGKKSPFQMTLSLTNRCNFKCEYCDIPLQKRDEMSVEEWCGAIDELRAGGMGRVSLIGGEPLIFDGVDRIIGHLKERGIHTAMNSNGWLVPAMLETVRQLDLICLTLDGPAQVHDAQRRKGSYEKVLEAIDAAKSVGLPLVTMTVLTPRGVENLEHVLQVAERHGFQAFFQLEHDKGCDVQAPIAPRLSDGTIAAVAQRLLDYKAAGRPVGNSVAVLEQQLRQGRYLGTCADCHAGMYYGYVLSDGTVAPCLLTQWQQRKSNGRTDGFLNAFNALGAPVGPGCSCVPTHEVNRVLDLNPKAIWHAVGVMLGADA
ncbi:MAG: radical SAM protein [Archangiaceae bacterium]|nr:radical SAM protein [Archangiaceae bacterium]